MDKIIEGEGGWMYVMAGKDEYEVYKPWAKRRRNLNSRVAQVQPDPDADKGRNRNLL